MSITVQKAIDFVRGKTTIYSKYYQYKHQHVVDNFIDDYSIPLRKRDIISRIYFDAKKYDSAAKLSAFYSNKVFVKSKYLNFEIDIDNPSVFFEIYENDFLNPDMYILDHQEKYTIIDIGANRGYTALFFAKYGWCGKVHAFECVPKTFEHLSNNVRQNPELENKICLHPYGLSNINGRFTLYTDPIYDSLSTSNMDFIKSYWPDRAKEFIPVNCELKMASEVFRDLLSSDDHKIIIKIDAEGAEYEIFDDLAQNYPELFNKVALIFAETHLGFERLHNTIRSLNQNLQLERLFANGDNVHMLTYVRKQTKVL